MSICLVYEPTERATPPDDRGPLYRSPTAEQRSSGPPDKQRSLDSSADSNAADPASTCATFEPRWSAVSGRQRTVRPDLVSRWSGCAAIMRGARSMSPTLCPTHCPPDTRSQPEAQRPRRSPGQANFSHPNTNRVVIDHHRRNRRLGVRVPPPAPLFQLVSAIRTLMY